MRYLSAADTCMVFQQLDSSFLMIRVRGALHTYLSTYLRVQTTKREDRLLPPFRLPTTSSQITLSRDDDHLPKFPDATPRHAKTRATSSATQPHRHLMGHLMDVPLPVAAEPRDDWYRLLN